MGKLIGIWAPCAGTGRTTITLAIAYKIAELDKNKKILVCCANGTNSTLIKTMGISSEEIGIEELVNFKLAGFVSSEYDTLLARKGRIFFAGSSKMTQGFSQMYVTEFCNIFDEFKHKFDICLVDLPCGIDSILGNAILSRCDKTIAVLERGFAAVSQNKTRGKITIINKYKEEYSEIQDSESFYNITEQIAQLPYCNILAEMSNKGKLIQYFSLKTDFNDKIGDIVSGILELKKTEYIVHGTADAGRKLLSRFKINVAGGQQG